jgi:hypothetical protein
MSNYWRRALLYHGLLHWKRQACEIYASREIGGLEKVVVFLIHILHILTLSGWIKIALDPPIDRPTASERRTRNKAIELYVILEFLVLATILWFSGDVQQYQCWVAAFILFEILLNLASIVFVGKLPNIYPATSSIERSLILFGINILQVIMTFAIFYRAQFGILPEKAVLISMLVFGTLGSPSIGDDFSGAHIVEAQVVVDFAMIAIFLSAYVGRLGAFRRLD